MSTLINGQCLAEIGRASLFGQVVHCQLFKKIGLSMSNNNNNKKVHLTVHRTLPKILMSTEKYYLLKMNKLELSVLGYKSVNFFSPIGRNI